jgi:hypothetical protein
MVKPLHSAVANFVRFLADAVCSHFPGELRSRHREIAAKTERGCVWARALSYGRRKYVNGVILIATSRLKPCPQAGAQDDGPRRTMCQQLSAVASAVEAIFSDISGYTMNRVE